MRVVPTFLGVAAILCVAATAPAQSAVSRNGVPDGAGGATTTDPYRIIDDFSFSSLSTVNGIRFWSLQESAFDLAGFEWTISRMPPALLRPQRQAALRNMDRTTRTILAVRFSMPHSTPTWRLN